MRTGDRAVKPNPIVRAIIALTVTAGYLALNIVLMYQAVPASVHDLMVSTIQTWEAMLLLMFGFYFGQESSSGNNGP